MPILEIEISVIRVNIILKFPSKLQIGFRINELEVFTEEISQTKSNQVQFSSILSHTITFNEDIQIGHSRKINIKKQESTGKLILYMVLGKRKITAGFISLNLNDILNRENETIRLNENWQRCSDKLASVILQVRKISKDGSFSLEPIREEEKESNQYSSMKQVNTEVEMEESQSLYYKSSYLQSVKQKQQKYQKEQDEQKHYQYSPQQLIIPEMPRFRTFSEQISKSVGNQQNKLNSKEFQIQNIEIFSSQTRPKAFSNSNFLSQDDQEYIKSLKIHVFDQGVSSPKLQLIQSLPTPLMFKKTLPKVLFDLSSPQDSPRQKQQQCRTSRSKSILKKKLQFMQQYSSKQLDKISQDLFLMQQKYKKLSVQFQIKQDQIKWLHEQLLINDQKIHQLQIKNKMIQSQSNSQSLISLKQLIDQIQSQKLQQSITINNLNQQLKDQKQLRLNYQQSITKYSQKAEYDNKIIMDLKQELKYMKAYQQQKLNPKQQFSNNSSIIKQFTTNQKLQNNELLSKLQNIQKQFQQQNQIKVLLEDQIQILTQRLKQTRLQLKLAKQELLMKQKNHVIDEQNIRQFEKQLTEKYKIIYHLQISLKDQRQKSRELSRSIEGKNAIGKLMEFSFNKQCNHNFLPLYNKVKEIVSVLLKNKIDIIKQMNVQNKDPNQIKIIKQYGYLQNLLRSFITALQQNIVIQDQQNHSKQQKEKKESILNQQTLQKNI